MGVLVAAILFGIGFAFLSLQNTTIVNLHAGTVSFAFPLFAVVLGAMLLGLFIAWFLSAIGWVSHSITLRQKDGKIRDTEHTIDRLETRVKELEFENERIRREKDIAEKQVPRKSFLERITPHPTPA